jgi:hypothetical protein
LKVTCTFEALIKAQGNKMFFSVLGFLHTREVLTLRGVNKNMRELIMFYLKEVKLVDVYNTHRKLQDLLIKQQQIQQVSPNWREEVSMHHGRGSSLMSANTRRLPQKVPEHSVRAMTPENNYALSFRVNQTKGDGGTMPHVELNRVEILTFKNLLKKANPPRFLTILTRTLTFFLHNEKEVSEMHMKLGNPLYCLYYFDLNFSLAEVHLTEEKYKQITQMFMTFSYDKYEFPQIQYGIRTLLKWIDACLHYYEQKYTKKYEQFNRKRLIADTERKLSNVRHDALIIKKILAGRRVVDDI